MIAITFMIIILLFYWRIFIIKDLNIPTTLFWIVWPDIASFIPIGLGSHGSKEWPRWGSKLYNVLHTFPAWIPLFTIWSLAAGGIQWPLLGSAGHILPTVP